MTEYTASSSKTIREDGADATIFTAYIDVTSAVGNDTPNEPWYCRISVHGIGKDGAEAMRDEVLKALQLRQLIKETLA